jgi:signal peptidase
VRRYLSFFGNLVLWLIIAFNAWFLWPSSLGGATTFVIVSGTSMEPLYAPGDLVVARKGTPAIGDVVVYRPEGLGNAKVVHQIVGGDGATGWNVKGINNDWLDQWNPTDQDVVGIVVLQLDADNRFGSLMLSPLFWGAFLLVAVGLLLWPDGPDDGPAGAGSRSEPAEPEPAATGSGASEPADSERAVSEPGASKSGAPKSGASKSRVQASFTPEPERRRRDDVTVGARSGGPPR